jgi:hypothetical protein
MAEQLDLTTPIVESKTTRNYKVVFIQMDIELKTIVIHVKSDLSERKEILYTGQVAVDYVKFINTANFSVKSLNKWILQRLSTDGVLVGTVSGAPDV